MSSLPPAYAAPLSSLSRHPLALALADIKIAHSVFALPFALLATVLASPASRAGDARSWSRLAGQAALIVLCMFLARTWAMLINRVADWRFDRENPRTERRAVASGRLSPRTAARITAAFGLAFVAATALFWFIDGNPWPVILSVPVLAWIALYSLTKRFTAWCHVFLGGALAVSPIAAAIAVEPAYLFSAEGRGLWLLAGMVLCWVAGFDIPYAIQDIDVDRRLGLNSVPARLGVPAALWVSRALHLLAFALLIWFAIAQPRLGVTFWCAIGAVGVLLVTEHVVLARRREHGLPPLFFTLNGMVSLTLGLIGCGSALGWLK